VTVHLPRALLELFPGAPAQLCVEAADVAGLLRELDARWPGMRDRLCDERPAIRRHLSVFVDGARASLDTPVRPGSEVYILTAMSGV
jgi:molybdopterin converting factor small subunit